jgi:hypothetical protein
MNISLRTPTPIDALDGSKPLPLSLADVMTTAIVPAMRELPQVMDTKLAHLLMLAIGGQESRFLFRKQLGDGPARSFWQFERGNKSPVGGVWGIYLHRASMEPLRLLCRARDVAFEPRSIWAASENDDVLAAGMARLLLWTDPKPLPPAGDEASAWRYYLRTWRPGKPHPQTWSDQYGRALEYLYPELAV